MLANPAEYDTNTLKLLFRYIHKGIGLRLNCSNRFMGMNVSTVYLEVVTALVPLFAVSLWPSCQVPSPFIRIRLCRGCPAADGADDSDGDEEGEP